MTARRPGSILVQDALGEGKRPTKACLIAHGTVTALAISQRKGPPERPMVPKASKAFRWQLPYLTTPVNCTQTGWLLQGRCSLYTGLLDPGPWTLAFVHWSRRTLVAIGTGRFRRSSFSARDGARNPPNQPPKIQ